MVGYMSDTTGQTKDAGWEVGVRQRVDAPLDAVWTYLIGDGLKVWLGDIDALPTQKRAPYSSRDGVTGTILGYTEGQRIRLAWQPEDWPHPTTLQVSAKTVPTGTTIAIHHENLADREERKLMLGHWKNVAAAMADDLRQW